VFGSRKAPMGCRKYEARFEDYLNGAVDAELNAHLQACDACRAMVDDARLAGVWLRDAWEPTAEPRSTFLPAVMARIREQKMRDDAAAGFWTPLEFLASRVSMTAAVLLLALSGYMLGVSQRAAPPPPPVTNTELSAADFPQPPNDPVDNEEVLQSLAERAYGH
jgi:predicted anti-sigma-YlaC factor YlaD